VIVASYERDSSNPDDVSSQSCPKPPPPTTREPHIDAPTIPTTNTLTWINAAPPHPTKEPLDIPTSFWGTSGGAFRADGEVTDSAGPFANVEAGSRMMWRGKALGPQPPTPGNLFKATMHITP
jgi:hypothetical protein